MLCFAGRVCILYSGAEVLRSSLSRIFIESVRSLSVYLMRKLVIGTYAASVDLSLDPDLSLEKLHQKLQLASVVVILFDVFV